MPALENPRHEAFAQARAGGARVEQAYEDAGFTPGNDHGARLARTPEVAERIAELRAQQTDMAQASTHAVIGAHANTMNVAAETARIPTSFQ